MEIILDEREHALYEKCMLIQHGTATPSYASIATMTKKVLPLGDVTVAIDDMQWIIERKSLSDLLSSIKDGRYDEQSYRLQHTADPRRVIYVIEGVLTTLKTPRERKLVHATMTSLQVFKGFAVIRTSSVQETAEWILAMADKIYRDIKGKGRVPYFYSSSGPPVDSDSKAVVDVATSASVPYCTVVKKVKKENVTPQNICEIVLCQLPGISHVAATAISLQYPSVLQLVDALRLDPQCLHQIKTAPDKNGKTRKLGANVHATIAQYLMFTLQEVPVLPQNPPAVSVTES